MDDNSFLSIDLMSSFRCKFQFNFKGVSQVTVRDTIISLRNSKSKDFFGLSVILIKRNIDNIISPLSKLINWCLDEGVFPNCLKIAKVIPLFKKGIGMSHAIIGLYLYCQFSPRLLRELWILKFMSILKLIIFLMINNMDLEKKETHPML